MHHAFFVDVRAEETGAVGFERVDDFFGGEVHGRAPASDDNPAFFGIEGDEEFLAAHGAGEGLKQFRVGAGFGEGRGTDDDAVSALVE